MKSYVGTKIILAEPMTDVEFKRSIRDIPTAEVEEGSPFKQGYYVQYPQPDGGYYDSWSPKEVFESCYRELLNEEKQLIYNNDEHNNKNLK